MLRTPEKLRFAHYLCFVQDVKERFKQPKGVAPAKIQRRKSGLHDFFRFQGRGCRVKYLFTVNSEGVFFWQRYSS